MPNDLQTQIRNLIAEFSQKVEESLEGWCERYSAVGSREAELELAAMGRVLCDGIFGAIMHKILSDTGFRALTSIAAKNAGNYRNGGRRNVPVTLLGGSTIRVEVDYLKPNRRGKRRGRKRQSGRRGKGGTGLYPGLAALGIWNGVTPALAGEICCQVADSESVRTGRKALARRDIDLGHKQTLRIVNKVGGRAVEQRNGWLEQTLVEPPGTLLAGKRVVVATDGGRIRMRVPVTQGRRRKNGHRGFETPWQEPKLFVIYVIDDTGRIDRTIRPIYDGTMEDCEVIFKMLHAYLRALGVSQAEQLVIIGDGAKWIWDRAGQLGQDLEVPDDRVVEVLDWYHAVEHLSDIASIPNWSDTEKRKWLYQAKSLLKSGKVDELVCHIMSLAKGRRAKEVRKCIPYFERNRKRIHYSRFQANSIPIGSGAIESAVRRVVNLRLKGNSKFWLEENAESMLLFRCYLKADRFDDLFDWSLTSAVPWWDDVAWCPLLRNGAAVDRSYRQKAA